MIRFLSDQSEHSRNSLLSYLLYNLGHKERHFFHNTHDKAARAYFIKIQGDADSYLKVNHTIAFKNLLQTIHSKKRSELASAKMLHTTAAAGTLLINVEAV